MTRSTAGVAAVLGLALALGRPAPAGADDDDGYTSRVRARRLRRDSAEVTVRRDDARKVAGTQGDPVKVVDNLPGVARAGLGQRGLVVWGAAPEATRVLFDGVELPALYHLGGLRSTVSADRVATVALAQGGWGAEHGRGLGALVRIDSTPLPEGFHGTASLDVLDAAGFVTAPVRGVQLAASLRYSLIDRLAAQLVPADGAELLPLPRYHDWQVVAERAVGGTGRVQLVWLGSGDTLSRTRASADPALTTRDTQEVGFWRAFLRYRALRGGAETQVTPWVGGDRDRRERRHGEQPAVLDVHSLRFGLRTSHRVRSGKHSLTLGFDGSSALSEVARQGSLTDPAREGDAVVFGQPPARDLVDDDFRADVVDAAPFVTAQLGWGRLTVSPGLRLAAIAQAGSALTPPVPGTPAIGYSRLSFAPEPRLALAFRALPTLEFGLAAGLYHQTPAPADLGAHFGNPSLGPERALHLVDRITLRDGALELELIGYYQRLDALVARSDEVTPEVARALEPRGDGQSHGVQLGLKLVRWHRVTGWISYTYGRSERRAAGEVGARPSDHDQTHVLTAVASWTRGAWNLGLRARYASGLPRTPALGGVYDASADRYEPLLGLPGMARLPAFAALDARVERTLRVRGRALELSLEVQNLTARENAEELAYSDDFSRRGIITGLPTLVIAGARLAF